jgi:chemotaxis-related protein WspB
MATPQRLIKPTAFGRINKNATAEPSTEAVQLDMQHSKQSLDPVAMDAPAKGATPVLYLLFAVGESYYAIESASVVEVIPRVSLRAVRNFPTYVSGLFNYRSTIVPVIDLCQFIEQRPSGSNLSTRIIMVSHQGPDGSGRTFGLLAERVTDTLMKAPSSFSDSALQADSKPYLGGVALDERGLIQVIHLDVLLRHASAVVSSAVVSSETLSLATP